MYKDILNNIENIAIWPVVSFIIFFLFFLLLIGWVITVDSSFVNTMSHKPFEDGIKEKPHHKMASLTPSNAKNNIPSDLK